MPIIRNGIQRRIIRSLFPSLFNGIQRRIIRSLFPSLNRDGMISVPNLRQNDFRPKFETEIIPSLYRD